MNLATYVLDHSELNFYLNKSNLTSFQYSEMDEKKHSFMQDLADSDYKKNIDSSPKNDLPKVYPDLKTRSRFPWTSLPHPVRRGRNFALSPTVCTRDM